MLDAGAEPGREIVGRAVMGKGRADTMIHIALRNRFSFRACIGVILLVCVFSYPAITEFIKVDSCLDAGGRWVEPTLVCQLEVAAPHNALSSTHSGKSALSAVSK